MSRLLVSPRREDLCSSSDRTKTLCCGRGLCMEYTETIFFVQFIVMYENLLFVGGGRPCYSNFTMWVKSRCSNQSKPLCVIGTIVLQLSDNCYAKQLCIVPEEDAYAVMKVVCWVYITCCIMGHIYYIVVCIMATPAWSSILLCSRLQQWTSRLEKVYIIIYASYDIHCAL